MVKSADRAGSPPGPTPDPTLARQKNPGFGADGFDKAGGRSYSTGFEHQRGRADSRTEPVQHRVGIAQAPGLPASPPCI